MMGWSLWTRQNPRYRDRECQSEMSFLCGCTKVKRFSNDLDPWNTLRNLVLGSCNPAGDHLSLGCTEFLHKPKAQGKQRPNKATLIPAPLETQKINKCCFQMWKKKKINRERNIIFNLLRGFYKQQGGEKLKAMKKDLPMSF